MGDLTKGTDECAMEGTSQWFIMSEAECVGSLDTLEDLFEKSSDSDVSNLIDDMDESEQGNSLALYNKQVTEDCNNTIAQLKRKYTKSPLKSKPAVADLSPRLEAVSISPQKFKRRLFEDSGIVEDETANSIEKVVAEDSNVINNNVQPHVTILQHNNSRVIMLSKFKELFGVSYCELTRIFRSDKSCDDNWVVNVSSAAEEIIEASKTVLQKYCDYIQVISYGFHGLYLLQFKTAKSRETVINLFKSVLNINENALMCAPPKTRSTATALYFYKMGIGNASFTYGETPEWIARHTLLDHQLASTAESFELSQMIQYCYDHNLTNEPEIAYRYALIADEDKNAAAFLKSNMQVKYVRDCCAMVKYYKRQEMKDMTISEWIWKCCDECEGEGDWKVLAQFFRYQEISFVSFMTAIRTLFKNIPKKNCLVIHGPPDTGKSYICSSLTRFMQGKVVSFMNRASHFWLQPLQDCKLGFLDDATFPCWQFMDVNMRNALDGNSISLDTKHKAPIQMKLPPLLVTSNIDVFAEESLRYLRSRLVCFKFPNKLPFKDNGDLVYEITDKTWKCFFSKFAVQLDLTAREDLENESGRSDRAFRCTAGHSNDSL
ncbi:E1 protein [Human papillomavirus 184]|uniref:Replication protein E1 n=2 Tax=Papillomaviridae TaxID=151340 RepID=U6EJ38_9PAPI|nr:E1 protein [Human papillomavirus 184]CDI44919.1 E1 protein [Human papillomavirus 184]